MFFGEQIISICGQDSICLTMPVFSDPDDPDSAREMNLFYSAAADKILKYARSLSDENVRRSYFSCRSSVSDSDNTISVSLSISYSAQNGNRRTPSVRRKIIHTWKKKRSGGRYFITGCLME